LGNWLKIGIPVIAVAILSITVISISAAEEGLIPSWIKLTAGFWVNDQISDSEFISALQFLVKEGILVIPEKDTASQSSSIVTTPTSSTPTPTPSPITEKYQLNLESLKIEQDRISLLITILDQAGKQIPITGELRIQILDFGDSELFNRKLYVVADSFEEFTNDITGKEAYALQYTIQFGKLSTIGLSAEKLYNDGLGNSSDGLCHNIKKRHSSNPSKRLERHI